MLADPQAFKDCMEGIYHALEGVEYDVVAGTYLFILKVNF